MSRLGCASLWLAVLAALWVGMPGVAIAQVPAASEPVPILGVERQYLLRPGDILDVKFFYNAELNELAPVRPDGRITLQLVGEIMAAGRTPTQLREALVQAYGSTLARPEVAVIVRQFAARRVYVGGEVNAPGLIELPASLSALQGIFQAGGAKRSGRLTDVVILRNQGTGVPAFIKVDLRAALSRGDRTADVALQADDIVWVPRTKVAKVNDFIEQYSRQLLPIPVVLGVNYLFGGTIR